MPYKDPQKRREAERRYRETNRELLREKARERMQRLREADPEGEREYQRRLRQEHPERYREYKRRSYEQNRERVLERNREWRQKTKYKSAKDRLRAELVLKFWQEQEGCCYLCDELVDLDAAILEHDHRCCPPAYFCQHCIRGVSCADCNHIIGWARDDPDRLEVIARNLRAKLPEMDARLASRPEQGELLTAKRRAESSLLVTPQ